MQPSVQINEIFVFGSFIIGNFTPNTMEMKMCTTLKTRVSKKTAFYWRKNGLKTPHYIETNHMRYSFFTLLKSLLQ